jgi:hypothetical protein
VSQIKKTGTIIIALGILITFVGCTSFGSSIMARERINYNIALQITNDEQLLLNLVRLHFMDSTAFIEVSSITAQSSFQSGLEAGRIALPNIGPMFGIIGNLGYSTQPTLVYTPLQGEDFIHHLMSPLTIERLVLLYHSGWDIKYLLSLCLIEINEINNISRVSRSNSIPDREFQRFERIVKLLSKMHASGGLDFLIGRGLNDATPEYFLHIMADVLENSEAQTLIQLLELHPEQTFYRIAYPAIETKKVRRQDTIYIRTRSVLGIMSFLSQWVEHDHAHSHAGGSGFYVTSESPNGGEFHDFPFSIKSQSERPEQAAVSVYYRNQWFYIDDADLGSKGIFSLLTQIFALQASPVTVTPPVLTLPVGR